MSKCKKRSRKTINLLPYLIMYLVGTLCSYCYFNITSHMGEKHEQSKVSISDIVRHFTGGCRNYGTEKNGEQ